MEPPAEARGPQPVVLGGQTYPHGEASTASSADSSRVLQVVPLHRVDFDPLWFRLLFYPQSCASLTVNTGDWRAVPLKPSIFGRQRVRCFVVPKMMEGDNACVITSPFEATIFLDPRSNIQQLVNTSAASILYVNALNLDGTSRAPESVVHPQMSRALYPGCYSLVTDGTSPVHVVAAACEYRSPTIMKPDIVRVEGTRRPHMPRQPLHRDVAALSRPGAPAAIFPALRQTKTLAIIRRASVEPDPSNNRVLTVREGDGQQHAVTMLQNLITTPGTQVWEARHPCYRESVVVIKKIRPLPGVTPGSSNVRGVITVEHQVHREIKFV